MLNSSAGTKALPRLILLWTKRGATVGLVFGCAYGTAIPFVGNIVGAALGILPGAALGLSTGATLAALVRFGVDPTHASWPNVCRAVGCTNVVLGGTAAALLFHQAGTRWVGDFGVSLFALLPATIGIVFLLLAPVPTEAHPFAGDRPNVVKGMVFGLALAGFPLIALDARLVGII